MEAAFACMYMYRRSISVCMCFLCARSCSDPCNSSPTFVLRQRGSRVRGQAHDINGTSRGEGLNLLAIQIAPRVRPSLLLIGRGLLRGMHPLPSESVNMEPEKTEESDLNWPLRLTTHLALKAKGQGFN